MTLLYTQLPQSERAAWANAGAWPQRRAGGGWAMLLAFACFLPYPALAVGNYTAIQGGNVVSFLLLVPLALQSWRRDGWWVGPALVVPLVLSVLHSSLVNAADPVLSLKAVVVSGLSGVTLLVGQWHLRSHPLEMLTGIALAALIHTAVGLWQLAAFAGGELPLQFLYVNPSFLSVQNNAQTIALYIRRPFGLFPEPSAMSSCLAPWVIFWIAQWCGVVELHQRPARWQRALFLAAAAGGLALMIVSQSGHTAIALAGIVAIGVAWLWRCRVSLRTYGAVVLVFGVALPLVLWLAASSLEQRIGDKSAVGNSSWEDRSNSLRIGLELLSESGPSTLIFGMGPGLSTPAIRARAQLDAVWSVLLTYIYETGLAGAAGVCAVAMYILDRWRQTGFSVAFAVITAVWLIGITLTTSYGQLLPLWLALGWLCVWPQVCRPSAAAERRAASDWPHPASPLGASGGGAAL